MGIERTQQVVRSRGWEAEAYNRDVGGLPDVGTLEDYEDMPVDFFGEAMLRGMGWKGPNNEEASFLQQVVAPSNVHLNILGRLNLICEPHLHLVIRLFSYLPSKLSALTVCAGISLLLI